MNKMNNAGRLLVLLLAALMALSLAACGAKGVGKMAVSRRVSRRRSPCTRS